MFSDSFRMGYCLSLLEEFKKMMNTCPCCSNILLRQIHSNQVYWFCRHCWQEMPVFTCLKSNFSEQLLITELPRKLQKAKKVNTNISVNSREMIYGWIGTQKLPHWEDMSECA
jgi:hypothetical protein